MNSLITIEQARSKTLDALAKELDLLIRARCNSAECNCNLRVDDISEVVLKRLMTQLQKEGWVVETTNEDDHDYLVVNW